MTMIMILITIIIPKRSCVEDNLNKTVERHAFLQLATMNIVFQS